MNLRQNFAMIAKLNSSGQQALTPNPQIHKHNFMKSIYRSIAVISCLLFGLKSNAQITGINTVPGTFATIEAAVSALNASGVGAGGATINVAAGHTETPAGPLVLTMATNGPNAANPLVIQKSGVGANPLITAFSPGVSTTLDGIFILNGVDYVTINGIDLRENPSNTTPTQQMEWGYALVKSNGANGAQNNTIKNATITLSNTNTASTGIYLGNHTTLSTTSLTVTQNTGTSSFNKFYNNTVQNAYIGYSISGYASGAPYDFYDQGNQVGKDGVSTRASRVTNFGGAGTTANGIVATNQNGLRIFGTAITSGTGSTGTMNGISLVNGTNSSVDVYNDTITLTSSTTTSTVVGINNNMGASGAGSMVNIYNCLVTGCTLASATSSEFRGIASTSSASYTNIYNNTISNNTLPGTGAFNAVFVSNGTVTLSLEINIYGNTISNNTKTGTGGAFYCVNANSTSVSTKCYSNTMTNNSSANSSGATYAYYNFQVGIGEMVYDNQISGLTGGTGDVLVLYVNAGPTATTCDKAIYGNTINAVTGNGIVGAIYSDYAGVLNVYKNTISNITTNSATAFAFGIRIDNVSTFNYTVNIYNNFISEIKSPVNTTATGVYGMWIAGSVASNYVIANNSVYLNATSTSTGTFGSAGIYLASVPLIIDFRNNIVVNTSTPGPTGGSTVALLRNTTTLTNLATTSGNNCLYAGTPAANRLIYSDGTNTDQTIQAFKNRMSPREQASFSELPPFINVAVSPYNLHLATGSPTQCESGGRVTPGITTDFDGQPRYPNPGYPTSGFAQAPDVGADEIGGSFNDIAAPYIQYTPLTNSAVSVSRVCASFATITDPSGVNNTPGTAPRLYYKKTTNTNTFNTNTNATDGWKYVQASNTTSPFSFTIDYTLLFGGSVAAGDVIQYFVVAQDLNGTPIVGINAGGFTTQPTSVNLTAANFPLNNTINQYTIVAAALAGTINVGPSELITSLTNAGGIFQAINSSTLSGNLTINITGDLTAETGTFPLNQWAEEGAGNYTVSIVPSAAVVRNIIGTNGTAPLIRFDGADRVNIDGRFAAAGNYLMFRNTSTAAPTIGFLNDAQNNTVQYTTIESGNTATSTALAGAILIGTTTGLFGNDNITIDHCDIRDRSDITSTPAVLINCAGTSSNMARYNDNCVISNNNIHDWFFLNSSAQFGISVGAGCSGFTITGNSFYQTVPRTNTASGGAIRAINISFSNTSATNGGFVITNNFIGGTAPGATGGDMTYLVSGAGVTHSFGAISVTTGMIPNSIQGNVIRKIDYTTNAPSANTTMWFGMNFGQGTHNVGNIAGNTIGDPLTTGSLKVTINAGSTGISFLAGILSSSVNGTINIQNNTMAGITVAGTTATGGVYMQWVQIQGTPSSAVTFSGNTIGSTVANSIQNNVVTPQAVSFGMRYLVSTAAPLNMANNTIQNLTDNSTNASSAFYGILAVGTVGNTGTLSITNCTIRNVSMAAAATSPVLGLLGICVQGYGGITHTVNGNTLAALHASNTGTSQNYVVGFQTQGSSMGGTFNQNRIFDIRNSNTGASPGVVGVYLSSGLNWTMNNNMVSISNGTNTNLVDMAGVIDVMAAGSTLNLNYNSIFVGGSTGSGTFNTTCYGRVGASQINMRNNLLYNKRTGGSGVHVAIANASATPLVGWTPVSSDYNAFIVSDTTAVGIWTPAVFNMSGWRAMSGGDAHSIWETSTTVSSGALFVNTNTGNLHIATSTYPEALGTPIAGVTIDYDGDPRSATFPTIGADELACSAIVFSLSSQTNVSCNGGSDGSATVGGTGGNGLTYLWQPIGGTSATAINLPANTYSVIVTNICGNTGTVVVTITEPAPLTATATFTAPNCNGGTDGSATMTVTGGTPNYIYAWSSGGTNATETNLAAGTYSVSITDSRGCTTTQSVTLTQPSALTASTLQTNVACNGGNTGDATVLPAGGTPGYTYLWSSGGTGSTESNLSAGSYTVTTTDAHGCTRSDIINIAQPTAIVSSMIQVNPTCNGNTDGSATVTPSGGTPNYTYLWSSGGTAATETGLANGTYTVTVTDLSGCTHQNTVTITEPAPVTATTVNTNPTTCNGNNGSINLTPAGGTAPYTYLWSNTATTEDLSGISAGTYTVSITDDNGCTGSASVTLTNPAAPVVTYTEPMNVVCQSGAFTTPPFTLSGESPAGGTWSGPAVTGNTFTPANANIGYNVITYTYTDPVTGCSASAMDSIWADICTGVPNVADAAGFLLYPNPNNGEFTIQLNITEAADVLIYDAVGQLVSAEKVFPGELHQVTLGASGAYMVTMVTASGERTSKRVIVTR